MLKSNSKLPSAVSLILCALLLFGFACAAATQERNSRAILIEPAPPADHKIAYGGDPLQFGELRLPKGAGPHPVVVFIHGGCWLSQYNLKYTGHLGAALAEAGVATWSIEYRRLRLGHLSDFLFQLPVNFQPLESFDGPKHTAPPPTPPDAKM